MAIEPLITALCLDLGDTVAMTAGEPTMEFSFEEARLHPERSIPLVGAGLAVQ